MIKIKHSLIILASLFLVSCLSIDEKQEIRNIVNEKYPDFEAKIKSMAKTKYDKNIFTTLKWEWKYSKGLRNYEYQVKYGYFRKLDIKDKLVSYITQEATETLTLGLISYNPKSKNKGIYIKMLINTKDRTIKFKNK